MPRYVVVLSTTGREVWVVEAENADQAAEKWDDGELIASEAMSWEVFDVTEERD